MHELWALKSQINWTVQGDRNTSFFHLSTLVRRKRNRITAIKNRVGEWLMEEENIANYIQRGFEDIYSSKLFPPGLFLLVLNGKQYSPMKFVIDWAVRCRWKR